jgi:plasmid stability protein
MPNQRAEGVTVRNFPLPDDMHAAAKAKAEAEGLSLAEVVRRLLNAWLRSGEANCLVTRYGQSYTADGELTWDSRVPEGEVWPRERVSKEPQ